MHLFNQKCHGEMIPTGVTRLLVILLCVTTGYCLQCYSCVREDNPDADEYCKVLLSNGLGNNTVQNCSAEENSCRIDKIIREDKKITLFKRQCAKAEDCTNKCSKPDGTIGDIICDLCCEGNLCNKGQGPTPESGALRVAVMNGFCTIGVFFVWFIL